MKKVLILLLLIFSSMAVFSSDLIIDSKTQTFSDKEKKIKLDGGVKVKLDNLTVESDRADVTIRRNNKLDTATFYDKPYAYEVNENKKREVKANILKVSLINKVVRAEGEAQSIITEGNTPIVVINADTKNDIKKMEEEIEYRIHEVRKAALDDVKETRAQGDLSENFEYHAAKRFKNKNESRIRYLQRTIKNATVIDDSSADDEVGVNNTVEVLYEDDESTETIKIVTTIRADSLSGMISIESPLGKALLGHKKGDRVLVQVNPQVEYYVVIKSISNTDDSDDNITSY